MENIFFLSAIQQKYTNMAAKRDFAKRWTGYYRLYEPALTFIALDSDDRVAGYLTGCADSRAADGLYRDIPYYRLFEDQFESYPAHFHINCHPDRRGQSIGTALVTAFFDDCVESGRAGAHIVTDPTARNVGFYRRLGMDTMIHRPVGKRELLFMAIRLATG